MEQLELFEKNYFHIGNKKIRLIEMFGGIGSQSMALRDLGCDFEHHRLYEYDKYPVMSYNAIHGTDFKPTDIRDVHGSDLGITDTDRYCYIVTYSFPCQDLSVAGAMRGMKKGSGTRSGLLWEVERILDEIKSDGSELPQVLLMENVPQVIGEKNIDDFNSWICFLRGLGYSCFYKILNGKDFGVPQNRERCFMLSILGNYDYDFPETIELKTTVRDFLEDEVDEKYYLNKETSDRLILNTKDLKLTDSTTAQLKKNAENGDLIKLNDGHLYNVGKEYCGTITSRYHKGIGGSGDNMVQHHVAKIKRATLKGAFLSSDKSSLHDIDANC